MLRAAEELRLARLWRDKHDTAAADKLVTSNLRLVARVAAGYRGYGLPYSDLISEGGSCSPTQSRLMWTDRRLLLTNANTSNFSCNKGAIHRGLFAVIRLRL
jgi:hypothetical protein